MRILLLSCVKGKLDTPASAQELYSKSPTFQKTLKYGKSLEYDKIYILSALHHLVELDEILEPYDKTLKKMSKFEKERWGHIVLKQMKDEGINIREDYFIFLTGQEYMDPISKFIPSKNIEMPMKGLRMGERMKWLNEKNEKY